jgi:hypothetical protein
MFSILYKDCCCCCWQGQVISSLNLKSWRHVGSILIFFKNPFFFVLYLISIYLIFLLLLFPLVKWFDGRIVSIDSIQSQISSFIWLEIQLKFRRNSFYSCAAIPRNSTQKRAAHTNFGFNNRPPVTSSSSIHFSTLLLFFFCCCLN